ncbi:hypothetical protein GTQ34_08015 [Muricauda sp. JGD-17]|uniref:YCII-related domain-containing protein n=1 Tax=Flagellimonas ochracea TaxID=2696472 RepID=A0A964TCR0_9FLAO|nr:hypothetical protein [Allomuricauda ochracea]NAY91859.1 hypothetical protein [Allomuricauda ochracea]
MKKIILLLILPLMAQAQKSEVEIPHFVALYTLGASWNMEVEPMEQQFFKEHSAFLAQLRKDSTIVVGARYSDTGMIVFKASDLKAAETLLHEDVAIQNELFNVEVHPFDVFYKGCID